LAEWSRLAGAQAHFRARSAESAPTITT